MCIVRVQSAFGIPVVYNDKRQPLTSFMRSLINGGTPEKIVEVPNLENLKKAKPSVVEEHMLSPQYSTGETYTYPRGYDDSRSSFTGHRTNGKGGWILRCLGHKPKYKDKRLLRNESGLTRPVSVQF